MNSAVSSVSNATVQSIFAAELSTFKAEHMLSTSQLKAAQHIMDCRTPAMGGHVNQCDHCGHRIIVYNSCRDRSCPVCQTFRQVKWLNSQEQNYLDVHAFHLVFTVPPELNSLFLSNQKEMYDLLFKASSRTVLQLCSEKKYLGAVPGMTSALHTWGQNLSYHPHIHMAVTGGGLTDFGTWQPARKKFFLPVKVLSARFRTVFLSMLKESFPDTDPQLLNEMWKKDWVVWCKKATDGLSGTLNYLGRYVNRVAISNDRILSFENGIVSFRWKDYADSGRKKIMKLSAAEFIRRFLLHVLPKGFRKIRHYGLYASRDKKARLALCRRLTNSKDPAPPLSTEQLLRKMFGKSFGICPVCHVGTMQMSYEPLIE